VDPPAVRRQAALSTGLPFAGELETRRRRFHSRFREFRERVLEDGTGQDAPATVVVDGVDKFFDNDVSAGSTSRPLRKTFPKTWK
jgi:hypothetical protein